LLIAVKKRFLYRDAAGPSTSAPTDSKQLAR
jgi:hypothetical protein